MNGDHIRRAVLLVLQSTRAEMCREAVFNQIAQKFRDVTEEQVWNAMIQLSFEGLIKVDYQPTVQITDAGREVIA